MASCRRQSMAWQIWPYRSTPATGKRAAVAVHDGDHGEQQRVDGQLVQPGRGVQPPEQIVRCRLSPQEKVPPRGAGAVPLDHEVPALDETGHLLVGEAANLQHSRAVDAGPSGSRGAVR